MLHQNDRQPFIEPNQMRTPLSRQQKKKPAFGMNKANCGRVHLRMGQECTGLEQASSVVNSHSAVVEQRVVQQPPPVKLFPGFIKQP